MAFNPNTAKAVFDPSTASPVNIKDTVALSVSDPNADQESVEKAKLTNFLQQKGYSVTANTIGEWKNKVYGETSSYSAVNKELTNQLSVEPQGTVKKAARWSMLKTIGASILETGEAIALAMPQTPRMAGPGFVDPNWKPMPKETWRKARMDLSQKIGEKIPESWQEARDVLREKAAQPIPKVFNLENSLRFLEKGGILLADNAPNMIASQVHPAVGMATMYANEKNQSFKALQEAGVDPSIADEASSIYGMLSAPVEYVENIGRVSSAFGVNPKRGLLRAFGKKLASAGINVGEEAVQKLFDDLVYNEAVTANNERFGTNIPLRDLTEGYGETAASSLAMSTVLEALGLGTKGLRAGARKITGHNGGALTTDDVVALREQPEVMENLVPSEEADLLKKAVNEDDGGALAEYNQRVVGVEEEAAPQEAPTQEAGDLVGISKSWDAVKSALPFDEKLLKPERVRQTETIKAAFEKGLQNQTDEIVSKVRNKQAITHEEVGALLIRKTDIVGRIDEIKTQMKAATADGNDALISQLGEELNQQIEYGIEITETARKGATEVARSLAAMAMQMDKKTFDLVNVTSLAQATKGAALTEQETEAIQEKVSELEAIEDDLAKLAYPSPSAELNRMMIVDEVERAYRRIKKKGQKKADKNADIKLIRKRQDKIFELIDEINDGKPKAEKVKKESQPDSEGYLDMITNLKSELAEIRKERGLDEQIAQMEADIEAGDVAKYEKERTPTKEESEAIMRKRARKLALQKEINRQIAELKPKTIGDIASDVWDVFRNLRLTADMGHLLRQGGVVMSNPKMWKSGDAQQFFRESAKALVKEDADMIDAAIMSHKNYEKWRVAGLPLIEEGQQLDAREEILMNGVLGKAPLGIGTAQKAFGRTQITGTNLLRLLAAESYLGGRADATIDEMRDIAKAVGVLTGRGATVKDPKVNKVLNKILTSPSFTASRFQAPFLLAHKGADGKYLWENKQLRNRIIEDSAWFVGTRLALMALFAAALPDAEIGDDPDHWTYGRLIVDVGGGQSRVYDPWAGIMSAYRALNPVKEGEFGEAIKKVFEGRKHPALSSLNEVMFGKTFYGEEIDRKAAIVRSLLPISVEGMREAIAEDTGIFDLVASVATDVVGIGSTLMDSDDLRKSRRKAKEKD